MAYREGITIQLGLERVTLVRRPAGRVLTLAEERTHHRLAAQLAFRTDSVHAQSVHAQSVHAQQVYEVLSLLTDATSGRSPTPRGQRDAAQQAVTRLAQAIAAGELMVQETAAPSRGPENEGLTPTTPKGPAPAPAATSRPTAAPASAPEPALPAERVDQDLQAQALIDAAEEGVPFCEECEKARRAQEQQTQEQQAQE